jgi:hypothetical protein
MIINAIRHLSKTHIVFAAANFCPHNLDSTTPIWPGHAGGAPRFYVFTQDFEEFPLTAKVTIVRGTLKLTIDSILVRNKLEGQDARKQPWKPITAWLLDIPMSLAVSEGTTRAGVPRIIHVQKIWWNKNGKYFPLIKLPAELRAIIFQHVFGENLYPYARQNHRLSLREVVLTSDHPYFAPDHDAQLEGHCLYPPNYNVLNLNKQLRKEAVQAGWEGTWKHFIRPIHLTNVLDAPVVQFSGERLSRVHLNFSVGKYLSFFGVSIEPRVHLDTLARSGHPLKTSKGLKRIELFFRKPYGNSAGSNPWYHFHARNRHEA